MPKNNESTTKFKVDISELKSAMQEARKQVAYANSEFKAASSSMDDWSKSSDGISAKLKQLGSNLKSQETVLSEYEKTLEEVKKEYGENSTEALEYATKLNNQQAVVNKIKKEIAGYEDALKEVSEAEKIASESGQSVSEVLKEMARDAKKASEELDDSGDSLEEMADEAEDAEGGFTVLKGAVAEFVGNALTSLVSGLKDAIVSLVTFGDEADKAMNSFQASTGATVEEMAEFEDSMKNIYKGNYGESFEDIATAMSEVKRVAGDIGSEELEKMTTDALVLRDTFDFEVSESMRAVNSLMDQFGITSNEAFNLMVQGAQSGLNQNGDLLDVINEYSVHFERAGYSADDMFNMLANGVETGTWSVDKLGDAFKEFNIRMSDGSAKDAVEALGFSWKNVSESWSAGGDDAKEVFNMLVNEMDGMEDSVDGYGIGVGLLGTMFEDLGYDALNALSQTDGEITKIKDSLAEINAVKYNSVGEALQGIGRNLQTGILMPISEKILPIVSDLAAKFQEWLNDPATQEGIKNFTDSVAEFVDNGLAAIKDGVQWFLDNKDTIIAGLAGIASGFVAFNVASTIMTVVNAFKAFKTAQEGATVAQWLLNTAMNANPILLIVTLVATLVGALITFIATNEDARAKIGEVWQKIKEGIGKAIESIGKFFTETIPQFFQSCIDWVKENWQSILLFLINPFAGLFKYFYENNSKFKEFVDNAIQHIKELPSKIWEWLVNTINKIGEWATDVKEKAEEIGRNFIESVVTFFEELPYKIGYVLGYVIGKVIMWGNDLHNFVTTEIPKFINSIVNYIKELPEKIWTWLVNTIAKVNTWKTNMTTKAKETALNFINKVIEFVSQLPSKIWTWLSDVIGKVTAWKDDMITKAKDAASTFVTTAINYIKELPSKIWTQFTYVMGKVNTWVNNMRTKAVTAGSEFISKVIEYIKKLPSKIGEWLEKTISKLATWVTDMGKKGKEAISELVDKVIEGAKSIPEKMADIGKNIVDGVWNGIKKAKEKFYENVKGFFTGLVDGAKDALGIESPSKVFAKEVGKWIPAGIAVGIDKNAKTALNSVKDLAVNTLGSARAGLSTATTTIGGGSVGGSGVVNNFTQVIHSPKQLSRLDIYRQSKNLLGYTGGGI